MPVSSRSSSSRFLFAVGTCALLVLIVILITGGFVVQAGPFRLSSHSWTAPFVIAVLAWMGAALHGRNELRDAAASMGDLLGRHATGIALVITASAAAIGVALGTYAASASDASAFVSHSELIASGRLVREEPLAREMSWPEAEWAFSSLGYRPGLEPGQIVPGYPLGLPAMMAAARIALGEFGPYLVTPLFAALLVFCTFQLGATLHTRTSGLVAAALMATSPIMSFQVVQPMSDVPAAACWALALVLALRQTSITAFLAGIAAGAAVLIRPNLGPLALSVAVALITHAPLTKNIKRLVLFGLALMPAVATLLFIQWRLYGSPLSTGYGDVSDFFRLSNIATNVGDYFWRLVRGEGPALLLTAAAVVVLLITRSAQTTPRITRIALLTSVTAGLLLAIYLPYGIFPDWWYLRFLFPVFPLLFVLVGALVVSGTARLPAPLRGLVLLTAVTVACAFNVVHAEREQAFNLRRYEARYRDAARYLEAALPGNAVVVTSQHSGSVRHYAGIPIVRWDLLNVGIDAALDDLRSRNRRPVLLIEDWERPGFRTKFPDSSLSTLDWKPRAEFGDTTRVFLFDPADRGIASGYPTDRVH